MPFHKEAGVWFNVPGCIAAYQPVGAPSEAMSRYNQAQGGDNRYPATDGVAPSWAGNIGWSFNGSTQYLRTSVVPGSAQTWSMLVRFSRWTTNVRTLVGSVYTSGGDKWFWVSPRYTSDFFWFGHRTRITSAQATATSGVAGFAGRLCYINGVNTDTIDAATGTLIPPYIGARNVDNSSVDEYGNVDIQAIAIYSRTLAGVEVWTVSQQIAYCDVNPEWSAWSRRRMWWYVKTPATVYTQAADGAQTNSGALARGTNAPISGAWSGAGGIAKLTGTSEEGTLAGAGGIVRETATSKAGTITPTGTTAKATATAKNGAWGAAGAITRNAGKAATGAWSGAGAMSRAIAKSLAGAWAGTGGVAKAIGKALAGAWAAVGALVSAQPAHGLVDLTLHARSVELTVDGRSVDLTLEDR